MGKFNTHKEPRETRTLVFLMEASHAITRLPPRDGYVWTWILVSLRFLLSPSVLNQCSNFQQDLEAGHV